MKNIPAVMSHFYMIIVMVYDIHLYDYSWNEKQLTLKRQTVPSLKKETAYSSFETVLQE